MSRRNKIAIGAAVVLVGAGVAFYNTLATGSDRPVVDVERIVRRNLEALVSASGTIQPKLSVDISSSVMGRVTRLAVNEGDQVETGQFLLQIDPESLESAITRGERRWTYLNPDRSKLGSPSRPLTSISSSRVTTSSDSRSSGSCGWSHGRPTIRP